MKMRRLAKNRKGAIASMGEIGFSLVLFVLLIVVFFVFDFAFGTGKMKATMDAENAAFTCSNNLIKFMNFNAPGRGDLTYEDLLLEGHTSGDYENFVEQSSKLFNKFSMNIWRISVLNSTGVVRSFRGLGPSLEYEDSETCVYRVAVPCYDIAECALMVRLELDYKQTNPVYGGSGSG